MSILRIEKGALPDTVIVPTSKSYANRALILAALKKNATTLRSVPDATDVTHLISALRQAGLEITSEGNTVIVKNSFPECENEGATIETGEGGTTARFLAGLLLLGKKDYTLNLGKRLRERPWDEFIRAARELGGSARLEGGKLHIQGPIRNAESLRIDCSRTTQFATAFDLVLSNTKVEPVHLLSSQSYLLMNEPIKEHFRNHHEYVIPADWSSASYPMTFAALNHTIHFPNLNYDPFQADAKLLSVLNDLGAVETSDSGLIVKKMMRLHAVDISMSDCLDLFPAMAFLVSHIEGQHRLSGLANLAHKESDRLSEMIRLLTAFGRKTIIQGDALLIEGSSRIEKHADLVLPDDHRIVMTAALFLRHHNGGTLSPADAVNKSYPQFFELMRS